MTQEIVDAVREIEREKGIESGTLVAALEDALLAAYKKTPGAARHATVELDDRGDFRVYAIEIPADLEVRLLDEAREHALDDLERIEEETGEKNHTLLSDDDLEIDWSQVPEDLVAREDVTPDNFGRIAAQTAKQVILQRIREAEREMMYDEYIDRVGEVVTGIVQQTGDRRNILVDLGDAGKEATVVVPDDQLALAIGKEGMNARLAARLTGWKIDITSDTEFAQQEAEAAFGGEEGEEGDFSGRCAAILANGKRCPNTALPGSKYCGVPAHQALALKEVDEEDNPIVAEDEPALEALSDTAEPEAVTEDAAAFAGSEPEEFAAGPGDAPVAGEDETLDSGAA